MPVNEFPTDDDRLRLVDQIQLMRDEHGAGIAADSDDPDDFSYLYDPGVLLVRSDDRARVDDVLGILNDTGDFAGDVAEAPFPPDDTGRAPLTVTRVVLPGRNDGDPRRVPLALDLLDEREVNTDEEDVVTPEHWMHFSVRGGTRLCPAVEPEESGLGKPWPALVADRSRGTGVRVSVVDSGWHSAAGQRAATHVAAGGRRGPRAERRDAACLRGSRHVHRRRGEVPGAERGRARRGVHQRERRPPGVGHGAPAAAGARARAAAHQPVGRCHHPQEPPAAELRAVLRTGPEPDGRTASWSPRPGTTRRRTRSGPRPSTGRKGVGSLDRDGRVSSFSNYGVSADVYALGRNVVNAYPNGTYVCRETPDKADVRVFRTGMARWSGTSFAAPVVVGLVAAELSGGGNVLDAWDAVLAGAGTTTDPDGATVPALPPPYL